MIESSLTDILKEFQMERPDAATLFEDLLFYVKDYAPAVDRYTLRFDNGFGAIVFMDDADYASRLVYSVSWPANAKALEDFSVTHKPFDGPTNKKYSTFAEMRSLVRKIKDYPPF